MPNVSRGNSGSFVATSNSFTEGLDSGRWVSTEGFQHTKQPKAQMSIESSMVVSPACRRISSGARKARAVTGCWLQCLIY